MNKDLLMKRGLWPKKKRGWLNLKWLFLLTFMFLSVKEAKAEGLEGASVEMSTNGLSEGYLEFKLPFYDD